MSGVAFVRNSTVSGNFPGLVLCVSSSMHVNKNSLHAEPTGADLGGGGAP